MRDLMLRFKRATDGSAATTYMIFTACWFLLIAAGVRYATPQMTVKLDAVSAALRTGGPYR